ncbi:hypothetical protein WBG78_27285 [Chryseolinea sp. T2]|uniref:hypothetical protein n=1 Tax=Chryseolinea sp. T2 TaxID=3129255 RepID=UPI0030776983
MDQYFNTIEYTVDWRMLISLISLAVLVFKGIDKLTQDSNKNISIKQVSLEKLLDKPNELVNELNILLNGQQIQGLNKLEIGIQNEGKETVNATDFHILPRMVLEGFVNIFSINVSTSNEFTTCAVNLINNNEIELSINTLEPKDYLRLEILFEGLSEVHNYRLRYRFKERKLEEEEYLKNWRIDKHLGQKRDYDAFMYILVFLGPIFIGITHFILRYGVNIDTSNSDKFAIGWKVLYFIPAGLVCLHLMLKWNKNIRAFHYGYKNVKQWFSSTTEH